MADRFWSAESWQSSAISLYGIFWLRNRLGGELTYEQVYEDATAYHHTIDASTEEADLVSLRIVELLSRRGFSFLVLRPYLLFIRSCFKIYLNPLFQWGNFVRPISQRMNLFWMVKVLCTLITPWFKWHWIMILIRKNKVAYATLTQADVVKQIQHFISGIWQIHPFAKETLGQ